MAEKKNPLTTTKMVPKLLPHDKYASTCTCDITCIIMYLLNQMLCFYLFSFLATGDSFWTLSTCICRGESTVAQLVYDVSEAIWQVMSPIYMAPPTENDWRQIEHRFSTRWNFPNCIGALDGKHIMMRAPPNSSSMFYNYKGYFSIILMALVDADYRFVFVDIGQYGAMETVVYSREAGLAKTT